MKRKRRANYNRIVAMLLISTLFLSMAGCIFDWKVNLKKESSYQKWVKALNLDNLECMEVDYYKEEKNIIKVHLEVKSDIEDNSYLVELAELIDNHNAFVEANPDYFKNGTIIDFGIKENGMQYSIHARSNLYDTGGTIASYDIRMLKRKTTAQIQYLSIDSLFMSGWPFTDEIEINVPVVFVDLGTHEDFEEEYRMESFVSLEQLVINYRRDDIPESELMQIKERYPDIEVYSLQYGEDLKRIEREEGRIE